MHGGFRRYGRTSRFLIFEFHRRTGTGSSSRRCAREAMGSRPLYHDQKTALTMRWAPFWGEPRSGEPYDFDQIKQAITLTDASRKRDHPSPAGRSSRDSLEPFAESWRILASLSSSPGFCSTPWRCLECAFVFPECVHSRPTPRSQESLVCGSRGPFHANPRRRHPMQDDHIR